MIKELCANPLFVLYVLQAVTYGTAAAISWRHGHRALTACYTVSAMLHGAFAACHLWHVA